MTARVEAARDFLAGTDWAGATSRTLAGDAGNRLYARLISSNGHSAILMDAPPTKGEDVRPFLDIGQWLISLGLSAPHIYTADAAAGFLLLEDLGDALFARVVADDPGLEAVAYAAAVDVLIEIAKAGPPAVEAYDPDTMGTLAGLAGTWYAGDTALAEAIAADVTLALKALPESPRILALRDYHAENLLWLPDRRGEARVGLLDFQDARVGHGAYDMASLLRDARRDVAEDLQSELAMRYARGMGWPLSDMEAALAAQGAQRNLRILGVFARLSLHYKKPSYVDLIPRVWRNLQAELSHPSLASLRDIVRRLPEPNPAQLKDLKERCGTIPTLV
ncbi:MAG: phosphotransferase [Pseudomonadota bacterium]